jgi:hypothetical protein
VKNNFHPSLIILVAAALLGSCAVEPVQLSRGADDPANANAPAAVGPSYHPNLVATTKTFSPAAGAEDMSSIDHAAPAPKSGSAHSAKSYYTCVMHPEIHSDQPGKCPKCGMTLVKKEEQKQ